MIKRDPKKFNDDLFTLEKKEINHATIKVSWIKEPDYSFSLQDFEPVKGEKTGDGLFAFPFFFFRFVDCLIFFRTNSSSLVYFVKPWFRPQSQSPCRPGRRWSSGGRRACTRAASTTLANVSYAPPAAARSSLADSATTRPNAKMCLSRHSAIG